MLLNVPRILQTVAITLLLAGTECTVLLDRSAVQCETDADCERFGGHPYCKASTCVRSYLQPRDCVLTDPMQSRATQLDFLNQCSVNYLPDTTGTTCLSFDNCRRVPGSCGK